MKRKVILALVIVFVVIPIGFGLIGSVTSDPTSSAGSDSAGTEVESVELAPCVLAKDQDLESIQSGNTNATFEINNAKSILVGSQLLSDIQEIAPNAVADNLVAGFIDNSDEIGVWAVGVSGGSIHAINGVAQRISVWGSAAQPGSSADQIRSITENSKETNSLISCVKAQANN